MCDTHGQPLLAHGGIWLFEFSKFVGGAVESEQQRWLKFFTEGERLNPERLPDWMLTEEMQQAMTTLKVFSEKERAYHAYQARQNFLREQRTVQRELEAARAEVATAQAAAERERLEKEQARAATERERLEKEQARAAAEQAQAEVERLKQLLRDSADR